jgi:outer membrane protein assembly factor BamB
MECKRALGWFTGSLQFVALLSALTLSEGCGGEPSTGEVTSATSALNSGTTDDNDRAFNRSGDILISDQFNNRVIEITPAGDVVWQFGKGPTDLTATSIVGVNDAQRVGSLTLMAGTGVPPASPPFEVGCDNGCPDNRVILVSEEGAIVWQYGQFGVTGDGDNELNTPVQATFLPTGSVLITDQANHRIIDVSIATHKIVWQYGTTGVPGDGPDQLNGPNSAELLANGHILISDQGNNRAIEVDRHKHIHATFTAGGTASIVAFASRLRNGDTLLTDSGNSRIVEVDAHDGVVWEYFTNTDPASNASPLPTRAVRLANGDTLISDQFNDRVIRVNHAKSIVASYGKLNVAGFARRNVSRSGLNAPYDAKVVDDFTGLTPPFGHDFD